MRSAIFTTLIICFSYLLFGQELAPVKWSTDITPVSEGVYELSWKADIDKGWTVYSQYTDDNGPVPTSINFESEGFELAGKSIETGHKKEGYDKMFDVDVVKFLADEPFVIKQKIKVKNGTKNVTGYLTYMTCNDEMCLPPTDVEFDLAIPLTKGTRATKTIKDKADNVKEQITKTTTNSITSAGAKAIESASSTVNTVKEKTEEVATSFSLNSDIEIDDNNNDSHESDSGEFNPVSWSFDFVELGNDEYELKYIAKMQDSWSVYSQFTSDDGPVPTEIVYEENTGAKLLGKATEDGHKKEGPDPLFDGVKVIKFLSDQPFTLTQKIKATKDAKLAGYLTYMTCDDSHCLPPTDVEFMVDIASKYLGPKKAMTSNTGISKMNIGEDNILDQSIPTIKETYANPPRDCGGEDNSDQGLLWSFVLGFMGGLLALLTPCVFPMIPLTVSYFTKDTKRSGLMNGLIYGASIVVIYVAMGLILTAVFGEEALNALSTNWIANTLFFVIFIFFAFSFFGYYEITLPSSWTTKTDSIADKGGLIGIFFMAFTLALVSFSCTGPIIGSAIVSAASNAVGPAVVMLGFSLALALPFGLFAAFPSWLNSLPRSGGWMNSVKVILGFLELAFAFKFLSVADLTSNWGILKYELFLGIWVLVAIGMALYLFGFIKFPHDSPVKKLSPTRWVLGLGSVALALYLATGFIVNPENRSSYIPKGLTSGIAPPANYNMFLEKANVDKNIKAKYPSYTKCANDIPCFKDYYEGLNYAKEINKPVFLDFTGHGCVNCRKTEEFIWVKPEVKKKLSEDFVLVSLYVDDRKKLDKTILSKRLDPQGNNVKIRNVGNKWADFQIVNFKQNSQPLYVMMQNDEKVISNPRGFREGAEEYLDYLDCGLDALK